MPKFHEAKLSAEGKKFALVVGRFNDFITEKLLSGALDALVRSGAADEDLEVVKVPGAFEIPLVAKKKGLAAAVKPAEDLYRWKDLLARTSPNPSRRAINSRSWIIMSASPKRSFRPPVSSVVITFSWKHSQAKAMVIPAVMVSMQ